MALRILSGMLFINDGPKSGTAVITFNPFALTTAPPTVSLNKARVIGADGAFRHSPASIVAARQFAILDADTTYRLRINDTVTTTSITISWAGTGPSFHEEIPFMVVGEVPDPQPIPGPGRPPRRPRKAARRRVARRKKARR
ncbi:MAG: hypothetical protein ACHQ8D_18920 [Candidatus Rokuibacteriota bacterium]|jgi:hypothetical protein